MAQVKTNATESMEVSKRELEHRKLAREAAAESIVLLQNDGALPLVACPIALYGSGAATTIKGGTGSGEVNERHSVTIERGLLNAGFKVTTGSYLREYEEHLRTEKKKHNKDLSRKLLFGSADDRINIMANQFQYPPGRPVTTDDVQKSETDVCIYVIARQAGECSDRKLARHDFDLTETEIKNLKFISENYKRTIVVINAGGQMDIRPLDDINVSAVIFFCQQGMEGGNAFADVLTGAVTPSGCLTSTWPYKYEDWPNAMEYSYLKGHTDFDEYKEGIYVGYRYFDSFGVKPRYEFGYGKSYTDFSVETLSVTTEGGNVKTIVKVTNTGDKYPGKKIVQIYVSAPRGANAREYQSLAAFGKTKTLAPGQSQEMTLSFAFSDIAGYNEETASYILEEGNYIIRVGESSAKTEIAAVVVLEDTITTEICENVCKPVNKIDEIRPGAQKSAESPESPESPETTETTETAGANGTGNGTATENGNGLGNGSGNGTAAGFGNVRSITFPASEIATITHQYKAPEFKPGEKTEEVLKQLTRDDMIKAVSGTGMLSKAPAFSVPGAAGYTTSHLAGKGIPNCALCDGPAGIRIQRRSVRLNNGRIKPVDAMMELMDSMPKIVKSVLLGDPDKGTLLYQHASAFPVGTAMAQTWNTELVQRAGAAIGAEMVEFGVTYWLAPGMNIHSNPLCGRNFEYYSEDPLLTGKMAAAVTRGVQSHEGCYVTIKHFATNNQEDNRNRSDSRVSEKTLRQIYLRGFRIAVEEGGAKSVMTSYNKLNGTYTPNSYDLCTNLLRCEWGFEGVVMTDWFSTGKGLGSNGAAIKAGNDLIMPGGKSITKALKAALEDGSLKDDELRLCCARVLDAAVKGRTGIEWAK